MSSSPGDPHVAETEFVQQARNSGTTLPRLADTEPPSDMTSDMQRDSVEEHDRTRDSAPRVGMANSAQELPPHHLPRMKGDPQMPVVRQHPAGFRE